MAVDMWWWIGFNAFVLALLALDLGVFHRRAHVVSLREAAVWSVVWVGLALAFNAGLYVLAGPRPALEFLTGYLIEKSLSVDNIFVFVLLFSAFAVPAAYQHRVLFWGILGALAMRGVFIVAGSWLLEQVHAIIYVFGALLIVTGVKMARRGGAPIDPATSPVLRWARRLLPLTDRYDGARFWTRERGRRVATPLFLVLLLVEVTDLVFAVDSIPAIFAVTRDPFLVYTSNVFAILGLRSLYFLLAGVVHRFVYLKYALAGILVFVGLKMTLADLVRVPVALSLGVIALALTVAIVASLRRVPPGDSPANVSHPSPTKEPSHT